MEIDFILLHGQLRPLREAATGEIGLIILEEGVTGHLPELDRQPGAAVFTAGLIPATCES